MNIEKHTKKVYNKFGEEYQRTRDAKKPERAYNEFLEMPPILNAVGKIRGKKLLDLGCGAGIHAIKYVNKGAKVYGLDLSDTLIQLAKERCPKATFVVGSMTKLPYKDNTFDIVTASLSIHYIKELDKMLSEVRRVLKKGGLFIFSTDNPIYAALEKYEDNDLKITAVGKIKIKKTGKNIYLGKNVKELLMKWNMLPGMTIKNYRRSFRTYLKSLHKNGLELIDLIECKPTKGFKKYNPEDYDWMNKCSVFSIYISKKK